MSVIESMQKIVKIAESKDYWTLNGRQRIAKIAHQVEEEAAKLLVERSVKASKGRVMATSTRKAPAKRSQVRR